MHSFLNKYFLPFLLISLLLSGCSLFRRSKRGKFKQAKGETVPKEKYNKLLAEYNRLLGTKKGTPSSMNTIGEVEDKDSMMDGHMQAISDKIGQMNEFSPMQSNVEQETEKLSKINHLMSVKKYGQAMKHLQELENSPRKQIKVRAKYMIGQLFVYARGI